jgi:hypothetical protein
MFASLLLFAQAESRMPAPQAFVIMVICLVIGVGSLLGLFASNRTLRSFAGIIGTENPLVGRFACFFGVLVGFFGAAAFAANLLGFI